MKACASVPEKGVRRPTAESLVFSFLSAADAMEARLEAALTPTGLSLAKLAVLHFLAEADEPLPCPTWPRVSTACAPTSPS